MVEQCFYVLGFSFIKLKCICVMRKGKDIHSIGDKNMNFGMATLGFES